VTRLVIKVGGAVAKDAASCLLDFVARGDEICVVHGAGPQISLEMERAGIPVEFVGGRRVTTAAGLAIVRASLARVNTALCAAVGERAVPLFGDEIGLKAEPVPALGLVGNALPSCPQAILDASARGRVPVVAPLAEGPLNVNADEAAAALAVGIGVDELLFLTDVDGLILSGEVVDRIGIDDASELLAGGTLQGGIIPKLGAAVTAARGGVAASIGRTVVAA
jgi:acetylglutamate kinase